MKKHPRIFSIIFIIITLILFIIGVSMIIKGKQIFGCVSWLAAMIFLINAVNCIWDSKKTK